MKSARRRLVQDIRALERRLRRDWSKEAPPLSEELRVYRQSWLSTLSGPTRAASALELNLALETGDPLLVGDYHALRRARSGLRNLVKELPRDRLPGLLLELLPHDITVRAKDAIQRTDLRLVDGRPVAEAYGPSLRLLAQRQGLIAGAWVDGPPEERDRAAAERWRSLQQDCPDRRWLLFFGDWHLAEDHLPRLLRERGGHPTMLHQSPEPIWERIKGDAGERILDLGAGHWAWLHTPPLAQWASTLQEISQDDPEAAAEATEELIEALAGQLTQALRLPDPGNRPSVWPTSLWPGFHATLPADYRRGFVADRPPAAVVFHPTLPAIWAPGTPGLNQLVEAAGHVIACDYPLVERGRLHGRLCARAFRRIWASMLNPFLRPTSLAEAARSLFPDASRRPRLENVGALLRAWAEGERPYLSPQQRLLAVEVLGARAGSALAESRSTDHPFVEKFLKSGGRSLGWEELTATIRAA